MIRRVAPYLWWRATIRKALACSRLTGKPEGSAKLAANPAGEGPASRTCPVASLDIPDGRECDLCCRGTGVNVPAGKGKRRLVRHLRILPVPSVAWVGLDL